MSVTEAEPAEPIDTSHLIAFPRPRRDTPRWHGFMVAVGIVMSMLVVPVVIPSSTPVVGESISVEENAPAEAAAKPKAMCKVWIGGWVQVERPCSSGKQLPTKVKQCLYAIFGAAAVASMFGAPLAPAAAGALIGCGGSVIK